MDTLGPGTHLELDKAVMRRGSYDDAAGSFRPNLRNLAQRRRSAPSLAFGKAMGMPWSPIREEASCWVAVDQCPFVLGLSSENGELLLEECVQVTEGTKTRERHLFLFSHVIIIAKLKSFYSYRVKHRVSLEDVWLHSLEEEDGDGEIDLRTSLVLAWPLALCLLSFRLLEVKERWLDTLRRKIKEANERAGFTSPPPDVLMKVLTGSTAAKTLSGGAMDPVIDSLLDVSALPRQLCNTEDRVTQPIAEHGNSKWSILRKLRKVSRSDADSKTQLFGLPLSKDGTLPTPITDMLELLWRKGPSTEGVFRKACSSKHLRTIKDQLNTGTEVDIKDLAVVLAVGLLKSFLKELPGSLLVSELFEAWTRALETPDAQLRLAQLRRVAEKLPPANFRLLQLLLCVLHRIGKSASDNKMDAYNLAVCTAPTLLQTNSTPLDEEKEKVDKVTELTQFLIEHCSEIFGEDVLNLLGDPDEYNSDSQLHNDSAYDSTDPDGGDSVGSAQGEGSSSTSSSPPFPCRMERSLAVRTSSSDAIFDAFTKPGFSRRCSEPIIFPSAEARATAPLPERSHDDSVEPPEFPEQPLKKPLSDDSFLLPGRGRTEPTLGHWAGGSLAMEPGGRNRGNCGSTSMDSSSCSLESTASNQSEGSVFGSSPLASPNCPRRAHSVRHAALGAKPRQEGLVTTDVEVKRRTQSMKADGKGLSRTRSLGLSFIRSSLKRGDPQKGRCGTLQEDSQSEAETGELSPRPRPLSAIEVFQQPPSYEQAVQGAGQPAPPRHLGSMRVQDAARTLGRKPRPVSMNDDFLSPYSVSQYTDCFSQVPEDGLADPEQCAPFRQRTMSESVSRARHETVSRRCSQPLFEEYSYAKESYV